MRNMKAAPIPENEEGRREERRRHRPHGEDERAQKEAKHRADEGEGDGEIDTVLESDSLVNSSTLLSLQVSGSQTGRPEGKNMGFGIKETLV